MVIFSLGQRDFLLTVGLLMKKYSSDGRVVRASASGAVDSGLIPSRVKLMTLN